MSHTKSEGTPPTPPSHVTSTVWLNHVFLGVPMYPLLSGWVPLSARVPPSGWVMGSPRDELRVPLPGMTFVSPGWSFPHDLLTSPSDVHEADWCRFRLGRLKQTGAVDLHRFDPVVPAEAFSEQLGEHIVVVRKPFSDLRLGLFTFRICRRNRRAPTTGVARGLPVDRKLEERVFSKTDELGDFGRRFFRLHKERCRVHHYQLQVRSP